MKRKHSHKHPPVCSFLLDEFSSQSNVTEMADNSNIKRGKDNIIRFEFPLEYILFCHLTQVHPALSQLLANLNMANAVLVVDQYICQIQDHLHFIDFQQQKVIMIFLTYSTFQMFCFHCKQFQIFFPTVTLNFHSVKNEFHV